MSQTVGTLLIVAVVGGFFAASAIWKRHLDVRADVRGRILPPDQAAAQRLRIAGELSPIPYGHHAWLAFEVRGLLFPLEPELQTDAGGRFTLEFASEAPAEPFSLVLLLVGAKGQRAIEYWLLEGGLGEGFPGFDRIPGSSELDRVQGSQFESGSNGAPADIRPAPLG